MILLAIDTTAESIILALKKDDKEDFFVSEKGAKDILTNFWQKTA